MGSIKKKSAQAALLSTVEVRMFAGHYCNAKCEGKAFSKDILGGTYAFSPGANDRLTNEVLATRNWI